jgi:cobalt/nickel transport system permease protein
MPLSVPGDEIVRFYFLSISYEGIKYASLISIKAVTAVLLIFPMIGTMPFSTTIRSLERVKMPRTLVQLIMFTYRYIFLFIDETQRMFVAMDSRGFKKGTNLHTLKTIGKLVGMLFVRSYERTEGVYQAMISRGYNSNFKYLGENEFRIYKKDILIAILVGAMAMVLIILGSIQ